MKISATVITLNEQRHIRQCLESLRGVADEAIVVDSGSQDETLKIAAELGARTCVRDWTDYSDQKNFAASLAAHEWILSLDADECLSSSLRDAILQVKKNSTQAVAFDFPRKAFYLGRWIEHSGWYPDHKVRLFLKDRARWEGQFVHESLRVDGPILRLQGDLLHFSCESVSEHLRTLDRYTTLAAQELWHHRKHSGLPNSLSSALATFVRTYWLKQGFRDGMQGFFISCFASYYNLVKYAKLWELEQRNK
ncbi:MAG: glycosyltransferase family 2 protein [Acidobacteria bacterium]|nr:glycosyltransferase family 2 protein [Acidobacteriota bacterium]MCI0623906.1 glycosyltransferase family 2 protein [Acidobacteriota bacterium]MCI0722739.1 glycosyltransferase family 2 protein [Acidobacteriota bacterium]